MMDRRAFLKTLGLAVGAAVLMPSRLLRAEGKKVAVKLEKFEKLKTVGGSVSASIKERTLLLVRDGEQSVKAYEGNCTHQQCAVAWDGKKVVCPCHGGTYDTDGKVLGGPPPRPLAVYPCTLDGERIVITLPDA